MPRIWTLILVLLGIGLAVPYLQPDSLITSGPSRATTQQNPRLQQELRGREIQGERQQAMAPKPGCPQKRVAAFVGEAERAGVIHRIDTGRSVPRIYVRPAWYELTIDDKKIFDAALQCWLSSDGRSRVIAVYHDSRTGKEVADSNQHGFSMQ